MGFAYLFGSVYQLVSSAAMKYRTLVPDPKQTGPNQYRSHPRAIEVRAALAARAKPVPPSEAQQGEAPLTTDPVLSDGADSSPSPNPLTLPVRKGRRPGVTSCGASNTATESHVRENGGVSVDWLTIHQVHENAPILGETLLLFCNIETGEVESQAVRGIQHRGSFDSSLQIRCDGRRVEVSGNPSRWGRRDNVFGFATVAECVELYNSVLRQLGLPEFVEEERPYVAPFQFQRSDTVAPGGPVITRVDLTRNYSSGSLGAARGVVAALASVVRLGRCGWLSPDGNTVAWGVGSRYAYLKYYVKGAEMRRHAKKTDDPYLVDLITWAEENGIVRQELSAKSMLLKRQGLDRPGAWTVEKMAELLDDYTPHREAGASVGSYAELFQALIDQGVPKSRARNAQSALYAYLAGHRFTVGENISKSAFYRLRSDIKLAGVDIAAPLNVATLPVRIRELSLSPAVAPPWYRWGG